MNQKTREVWSDINGYERYYQVSDLGRVRSVDRITYTKRYPQGRRLKGRVLRLSKDGGNYKTATLYIDNIKRCFHVHRLVAETLLLRVDGKNYVDHINGIRSDNRVCNLRWCTCKENHNFPVTLRKRRYNNAIHPEWGMMGREKAKMLFCKPIAQYDKHGCLVRMFRGVNEARNLTGINNISNCLHGKYKFAGGYFWKFIPPPPDDLFAD